MPIAISTQKFSDHPGQSVLDDLNPLGFSSLFLGAGLWPLTIKRVRKKKERPVVGLTLFAERPDFLLLDEEPLQRLPLLVTDQENRSRTIELSKKSIHFAASLEVEIVVVPLLSNQPDAPRKELLDAARTVLEQLLEEAERQRVTICVPLGDAKSEVENQSIPSAAELQAWRQEFSGAPLRYWHHAKQAKHAAKIQPKEQKTNADPGGILLATDEMIAIIANPLSKSLLPPEQLLSKLGFSKPKEEPQETETLTPAWEPTIEESFASFVGGVEIEAVKRESWVKVEAEQVWVVL